MKHLFTAIFPLLLLSAACNNMEETRTEDCDCQVESLFESTKSSINATTSLFKTFIGATPNDISFANEDIGYIAGSKEPVENTAVIAKTTDGGNTWLEYPVYVDGSTIDQIQKIYAKNSDLIYASFISHHSDEETGTCVSEDSGCSWKITNKKGWHTLFFTTEEIGFMVIRDGDILKTKDGGKEWTVVYSAVGLNSVSAMEKCFFTSEKVGYAYAGSAGSGVDGGYFPSGKIIKTTDGGENWLELTSWNEKEYPTDIIFADDHTGYAFTFDNNVYKTSDGGKSWALIQNIPLGQGYYSAVLSGNTAYMTTANKLLISKDDFKTIETLLENTPSSLGKIAQLPRENIFVLSVNNSSVIKINN